MTINSDNFGFRFREWDIYKDSREFRVEVNKLLKTFPIEEKYVLIDQTKRALNSIILNIAESANKNTDKDMRVYINRAHCSLDEVVACLDCALDDKYITKEQHRAALEKASSLAKRLNSFNIHLLKSTVNSQQPTVNQRLSISGQSLIEVLIGLAVGGILIAGASGAIALLLKNSAETRNAQTASFLAQELTDNLSALAEADWHKIYGLAKGAANHYYISSSTREIISGEEPVLIESKNFTRYFYVENVNRTKCGVGDITENAFTTCASWPGDANAISEDPSTQKLTVKIEWSGGRNISQTKYLTRSRNISFRQTDWSAGPNQENFPTSAAGTIVNNKFASSTNVNYSTSTGSIVIQGF
jgi:four helix bundle protein